jgi:AcrR family transcriptional regulator
MPATPRTPRRRWIDEALHALADGGPDAVRVEALARTLGVTKGGFYGHFPDRDTLLTEVLDSWEQRSTTEVVARVDSGGGDGRARLRRLFALAAADRELLRIDLAVRDWARRDPAVAARLRRVDDARSTYLRVLFGGFCDDEDDIEVRALTVTALWIGSHFLAGGHGPRSRAEVMALALDRLLA